MSRVVRPYRGVSADERRAERRRRLMEAAFDVVGEAGLENLTTRAVCARAGLTERYFYESFGAMEGLLEALYDIVAHDNNQAILRALESAPPDLFARTQAALGAVVEHLTGDARRARFYVESMGSGALRERHERTLRAESAALAGQMIELGGLDEQVDGPRIRLAALMIVSGMGTAVTEWLAGRLPLTRDELIQECGRLCVAAAEAP